MAEKRPLPSPTKQSSKVSSGGVFGRLGGLLWRSGSATGKPPAGGGSKKKVKVNLPEGNDFYFDEKTKCWKERGKEANGDGPERPSSPPRSFSGPSSRIGSNVSLPGMGMGDGAADVNSPSLANGSAPTLSGLSPNAYSNRGSAKDLRNRYVDVSGVGKRGGQDTRAGSFGSLNELLTPGLSSGVSGPSSVGKVSMFMPQATASTGMTPAVFNPVSQTVGKEEGLEKSERRLSQSTPSEFGSSASPGETGIAQTTPTVFVPQLRNSDDTAEAETGPSGDTYDGGSVPIPSDEPKMFVPDGVHAEGIASENIGTDGTLSKEQGLLSVPAMFEPQTLSMENSANGGMQVEEAEARDVANDAVTQMGMFVTQPLGLEENKCEGVNDVGGQEAGTAVHPATKPLDALFDETQLRQCQSGADFFEGLPSPATPLVGMEPPGFAEPSSLGASNLGGEQLSQEENTATAQPNMFAPELLAEGVEGPGNYETATSSLVYGNGVGEAAIGEAAPCAEATYATVPYLDVNGNWQEYYGDINGDEYKYYYQAYCDYCAYYYGGQAAGEHAVVYGVEDQESSDLVHEQQQNGYVLSEAESRPTVSINDDRQWEPRYTEDTEEPHEGMGDGLSGAVNAAVAESPIVGGEGSIDYTEGMVGVQNSGEPAIARVADASVEEQPISRDSAAPGVIEETHTGEDVTAAAKSTSNADNDNGSSVFNTAHMQISDKGREEDAADSIACTIPDVLHQTSELEIDEPYGAQKAAISDCAGQWAGNEGTSGEVVGCEAFVATPALVDDAAIEQFPSTVTSTGIEEDNREMPKRRSYRKKKTLNRQMGKLSRALPWEEEEPSVGLGSVGGGISNGLMGLGGLLSGLVAGQVGTAEDEDIVPLAAAPTVPLVQQPSVTESEGIFYGVGGSFAAAELPLQCHRDETDAGSSNCAERTTTFCSDPQSLLPTPSAVHIASAEAELLPTSTTAVEEEVSCAFVPEAVDVGFCAAELPLPSHVDPAEAGSSNWPEGRSLRSVMTGEGVTMSTTEVVDDTVSTADDRWPSKSEPPPISPSVRFASAELDLFPTRVTAAEEEVPCASIPESVDVGFCSAELPLPSRVDPAEAGSSNWPEGRSIHSEMTGERGRMLANEVGDDSVSAMDDRWPSKSEPLPTSPTVRFASAELELLPTRAVSAEEEIPCASIPEAEDIGFCAAELPLPSHVDPAEAGSSNWPEGRSIRSVMTGEGADMFVDEADGGPSTARGDWLPSKSAGMFVDGEEVTGSSNWSAKSLSEVEMKGWCREQNNEHSIGVYVGESGQIWSSSEGGHVGAEVGMQEMNEGEGVNRKSLIAQERFEKGIPSAVPRPVLNQVKSAFLEEGTAAVSVAGSGGLPVGADACAQLSDRLNSNSKSVGEIDQRPVHLLSPPHQVEASQKMVPCEPSDAWNTLALSGAVDCLWKGVEAVQAAEALAAEVATCRLRALEAENIALREGRLDAADRCHHLERRVNELHSALETATLPPPIVYRAELIVDETSGSAKLALEQDPVTQGALEAENAALRSELGRRMEEVARLLELEGGQNQLLREQLDKRGVEVEMLVELEHANSVLRGELEEKEAALRALHEQLEELRAGGWADLVGENEALAAEQARLTVLLAEAREKAHAELEAPSTPGEDVSGVSEGRLLEAAEELAVAMGRVEALQTSLAEQAAEAEGVQEGLRFRLEEQTAIIENLEQALAAAKAEATVLATATAQRCAALDGQMELVAEAAETQDFVRAELQGTAEAAASLAMQLGQAQAEAALLAEGRDRAEEQKAELQVRVEELDQAVSLGQAECQALRQQLSEVLEREVSALESRRVAEAAAEGLQMELEEAVAGRDKALGELAVATASLEAGAAENAARVEELELHLADARAEAAGARAEAESARAEAEAGVEAGIAAQAEARAKLKAAVKKGKGIEKELDDTRAKLKAAIKKGKAIEKDKEEVEGRLAEAEAATVAAESRCSELSAQLEEALAADGTAAETVEMLRSELSAAAAENEALKCELHSAFAAASVAEERMEALRAAAVAAEASMSASESEAVTGDAVAAAVVEVAEKSLNAARETAGAAAADAAALRSVADAAAESAAADMNALRREMDALRARAETAESRLSIVEAEGDELRATVEVQQGEFNDLLACLGQETAKVEALQAVLEEQGVDVADILAKVEEEYGFGEGEEVEECEES